MRKRYTLLENNATVEFLNNDLVHISFNESGRLSTQLMRELKILSKIKTGGCPKAYMLEMHDDIDMEQFFCRVCRKAERYAPGTILAIICQSFGTTIVARNYLYVYKPKNPFKVFNTRSDAEAWISSHLEVTIPKCILSDNQIADRMSA